MKHVLVLALGSGLALSCSAKDEPRALGDGQKACQDLAAKRSQCGFISAMQCYSFSPCVTRCGASASCDELAADQPSGAYLDCIVACGVRPSAFACQNGEILSTNDRCDGVLQCSDGSDERGCGSPDGGRPDAMAPGDAGSGDASLPLGDR